MNKFMCGFVKVTGWLPFVLFNRPKIFYEDKKIQSRKIKGKAIVMCDHHSVYDFASMMYAFPNRNLRCVVAELMFDKGKFIRWFLGFMGAIKVDRHNADFTFVNKGCDILNNNGVVEIYPESRLPLENETTPLPFTPSVTYLALSAESPIIPVVTNGKYKKRERLKILIGKPINIRELYNDKLSEKDNIDIITNKLRDKIKVLSDEIKKR